jgi:uncharacterized hydrophobic protein (TIGR00271 family)
MNDAYSVTGSRMSFSHWWASQVVFGIDHRAVVEKVRSDAGWSAHFAVMTLLSAGIAVLGLLLSSPAVVIGAMLISPLMDPIIGLGFAVATFDGTEIRRSGTALIVGTVIAVAFCALIVVFSPIQTVTSEISARTRPNLFDLLVALFSGLAGTYAMIRGRHGAIVGVAIATALMPPLAVVGFGLATLDLAVLAGSALLFFTNLMTIAAAAAILARMYGFAPDLSPHQTRLQATLIVIVLIALAVPLGLSLRQIAWEAFASGQARSAIASEFPSEARVSELDIDFHARPVEVAATVVTPQYRKDAEARLRTKIATVMRAPVILSLDQIRTADGSDSVTQAPGSGTGAAERSASRLAQRLALVAGVPPENVFIDAATKRAFVRAAPIPRADVGVYQVLEARVAEQASGWTVLVMPPPAALPDVSVSGGNADEESLNSAIWAARRLRLPVGVTARKRSDAALVQALLEKAGVSAEILPGGGPSGAVALKWLAPAQAGAETAPNPANAPSTPPP